LTNGTSPSPRTGRAHKWRSKFEVRPRIAIETGPVGDESGAPTAARRDGGTAHQNPPGLAHVDPARLPHGAQRIRDKSGL
jgi:hypothetical protein